MSFAPGVRIRGVRIRWLRARHAAEVAATARPLDESNRLAKKKRGASLRAAEDKYAAR
jgi:hypothetical protein